MGIAVGQVRISGSVHFTYTRSAFHPEAPRASNLQVLVIGSVIERVEKESPGPRVRLLRKRVAGASRYFLAHVSLPRILWPPLY